MKNRIFPLFLALVLIIGLLPVTAHAKSLNNGLHYEVYTDHVEITDYTGSATEVVIPAEIDGLPVTSIGRGAFERCEHLTSISLPGSITSIGDYAFNYCSSLSDFTIPDGVTSIGSYAFQSCSSLTAISIADSVTSIGNNAFLFCSALSGISIPDSVTSIGDGAFCGCSSLTTVSIPDSVDSIGVGVFTFCSNLTGIHVDKNNPNYSSDDQGILFNKAKKTLIQVPGAITDCTIPDSVKYIGKDAFRFCQKLTSIVIPDNVSWIGDGAFYGCIGLTSISIPGSVANIGVAAFCSCISLTTVSIEIIVTTIRNDAFSNCTNLTSIYFSGNPHSFGENIFRNVTATAYYPAGNPNWTEDVMQNYGGNITWVELDSTNSNLVYTVHEDHVEITGYSGDPMDVVIPGMIDGLPVASIGIGAFSNCGSLRSVSIPSSVTSIGYFAFAYCPSLAGIHVDDNNPNYSSDDQGGLYNKEKTKLIHAPGTITSYTIPGSVTAIDAYAFSRCRYLTSISIPSGVTTIGNSAFVDCNGLKSIHIPNSVTHIGDYAFSFCSSLTSVSIPDSVISIGDGAFSDCTNLTSIYIPANVTYIGKDVFLFCPNLTGIHVNDNNPNYYSDDLGILFNEEITQLLEAPGAITTYAIPDSVTSIGGRAFSSRTRLTNITIPNSVAYIDVEAFSNCSSLTSIHFKGDAPAFGTDVFDGATATAYYPAGNLTWTADVIQNYSGDITWINYNPEGSFYDVQMDSWYEIPVEWAVEKGITNGTTADTFNPSGACLRAQVVTFLHRAAENPEPTSTVNPFTDVKTTDFFYKPVLWAVEKGITNGTSATTFGSFDVCNRAAVVTFLWRAAGSPEPNSANNPFTDVKTTDFFYKPVLWAIENGITNGLSATSFGPTAPCNRAQVVTFLYRAYN